MKYELKSPYSGCVKSKDFMFAMSGVDILSPVVKPSHDWIINKLGVQHTIF